MKGLQPGHVTVRLRGSAGQSLGAFAVQGVKLKLYGDSNDYVGKGLSGGTIIVRPMVSSQLESQDNVIIVAPADELAAREKADLAAKKDIQELAQYVLGHRI